MTAENHYVIIVHGTFNAPTEGQPPLWYQPGGAFAKKLQKELEKANPEFKGAVWRGWPDGKEKAEENPLFTHWSGANTHPARVEAGKSLSETMLKIWADDPQACIHLIGHSHGGNVVLKALEAYGQKLNEYEAAYKAWVSENEEAAKKNQPPKQSEVIEIEKHVGRFMNLKAELGNMYGEIPLADVPEVHRIGRVVTLGTPFFLKRWRLSRAMLNLRQSLVRGINLLNWVTLGVLIVLVAAAVACYLPILLGSGVLDWAGLAPFVGFNPFAWEGWLGWVKWLVAVIGVGFVLILMIGLVDDPKWKRNPENTNYYFDQVNTEWLRDEKAPRIPALLVNAGALDEALMALSSQPLLEMLGRPSVEAFTNLRLHSEERPPEIGLPHDPDDVGFIQGLFNLALAARNLALSPIFFLGRKLFHRRATDWLMNTLRQVVVASATGLPPYEVDDANLEVRAVTEVPALDDDGEIWDVSKYLAYHRNETISNTAIDPERYSFFWDADTREKRFGESHIASALQKQKATNPALEKMLVNPEFQRMCLAIEERLLEVIGGVEVQHARYFQDERIVRGVAQFIAVGTRPEPLEAD